MCTLVTSGQVASNTRRPRARASSCTALRNAVRAEDDRGAVRHLVEIVDEHRAQRAQPVDDETVVHDFVPHVDRRAEQLERPLDDVDRAVDTGAEAARIGEQDLHVTSTLPRGTRPRMQQRAPIVMAQSATLNAGKYAAAPVRMNEVDRRSRARCGRSRCRARRRASAPARWRACACPRGSRHSQTTSAMLTASASTMKNQRCQPDAPARKLNAAPVLCSSVKSSTGSTSTRSYRSRKRGDQRTWSPGRARSRPREPQPRSRMRRSASASRVSDRAVLVVGAHADAGRASCRTVCVRRGATRRHRQVHDTAAAELRMRRARTDVVTLVPAAHALGCIAGSTAIQNAASSPPPRRHRPARVGRVHTRLGGDQHEAQLIAQRLQARVPAAGRSRGRRSHPAARRCARRRAAARAPAAPPRAPRSPRASRSLASLRPLARQFGPGREEHRLGARAPGMWRQISSAVNDSTGASQRTIASRDPVHRRLCRAARMACAPASCTGGP